MRFQSISRYPSARSLTLSMLLLAAAALACGGTTDSAQSPRLSSTFPLDAATAVTLNASPSAVFDRAMSPIGSAFTLKQGSAAVAGTVSDSDDGTTATFLPAAALAASSVYTATISREALSESGVAIASARSWSFTTGTTASPVPLLLSTSPSDTDTGVALNARLSAVFDTPMAALNGATFTLKQGAAPVAGAVASSADAQTATFAPAASLAAGTVYTATITAGARSAAGAAFAADRAWTFTTGAAADTTPPTVDSTSPVANGTGIAVNTRVAASFSKAMDPQSLTSATFTVKQGNTSVAGSVAYGPGAVATFTPAGALGANAVYTAALAIEVKDLQGNALASAVSWSFTTGTVSALGPAMVGLGTSGNYAVLAKTAISSVPASAVTGDIGVGPAAATYLTGFSLTADSTNVFSTSPQITGKAFAANYAVPTPSNLTTAVSNMQAAYTDAASRPTPDFLELGTGNIGGKTLAPGLYKWTSTVTIPTDVTISGGANDTWIFQTTGDLTMAAAQHVILSGGAQAKNVVWQVAGKVTVGANAHFEGIILCKTQVTLQTGASMNGRILAQTQVALQQATVTQPAP